MKEKIKMIIILIIITAIIILLVIWCNKYKENSNSSEKVVNSQNNINVDQNNSNNEFTKDLSNYSYYELLGMNNSGEEIDESDLIKAFKRDFNKDENSIMYSLMKNDYDEEIFLKYYSEGIEKGDIPNYPIIECNYENNLGKYTKPIIFTMAMVKDYLYNYPSDSDSRIDTKELRKFEKALREEKKERIESGFDLNSTKEIYESLNGISIKNGNCKSEDSYKNNSRAKKLQVTINNKEKHIIELEDTMEVQFFDLNYKQYDIGTPITVKIELLEKYEGLVSDDVYIHEIGVGINSYGFGGI